MSEGLLNSRSGTADATGTVVDYTTPRSETAAYQIIGSIRDRVRLLGEDVQVYHRKTLHDHLQDRAAIKARDSVKSLLAELAEDFGMSWVDIARLVKVSVSAVRKWRKGGESSAESRMLLAQLAAFLDVLREYAVEDPAQWIEIPISLPSGYNVRPYDLYLDGHATTLLDYANQHRTAEEIMDDVRPGWRSQESPFEVFDDTDGFKSIRPRQA